MPDTDPVIIVGRNPADEYRSSVDSRSIVRSADQSVPSQLQRCHVVRVTRQQLDMLDLHKSERADNLTSEMNSPGRPASFARADADHGKSSPCVRSDRSLPPDCMAEHTNESTDI